MPTNDRTRATGSGRTQRVAEPFSTSAPMRRRSPLAALAVDWRVLAGIVLLAAGIALAHEPAANLAFFHVVNDLGRNAPALWSDLSVAGLGLAAWIYLTFEAQDRPVVVARLFWILLVGGLVIQAIKHGFPQPRPLAALGPGALTVVGGELKTHSMPSGHSALAFAMLGLMAHAPARSARAPRAIGAPSALAWPALLTWGVLAVGIAMSRMSVGAHWPSDVFVGAGLGLVFAALAERAWPVAGLTRFLARPAGARVMTVGLLVSAVAIAATPRVLASIGAPDVRFASRLDLRHLLDDPVQWVLGGIARLGHASDTGYPLAEPLQWMLGIVALWGAARWWLAGRYRSARTG
ncbi:MAG TPA: phosphatase PAP2 family protein [Burkholderiaceae bacterium]|nr:phosphatase PAP2 family protein [Burkholderiaceae bacterium]